MTSFRLAFVPGVSPDRWVRTWREREPDPIDVEMIDESRQREVLVDGTHDMCFARLPIDRDGVHCIPLWTERPVVVAGAEHLVAAADDVELADLVEEQFVLGPPAGLEPTVPQLDFPPMSYRDAVEVAASGTGVVLLPQSVARLHQRKDVVWRPIRDAEETQIGLCWLIDNDDDRVQRFIGIVRGRTARSSR